MKFLSQALRNALENIGRHKLVNFLCLGIIAFSLFVVGVFWFISQNLDAYVGKLGDSIAAIFYLKDGTLPDRSEALLSRVQQGLLVQEARLVSPEEARRRFLRDFPELGPIVAEFPESPFPPSLEVTFKPHSRLDTQVEAFVRDIRHAPEVENVQLNSDWAKRITQLRRFISVIGLFLGLILVFVSVFIIFNVIKLNIFYRREEAIILRLVGATDGYIRVPFLIEGTVLGLTGGVLACLLLVATVRLFPLYSGNLVRMVGQLIPFAHVPPGLLLNLVGLGALIGFLSSGISLKRFLR